MIFFRFSNKLIFMERCSAGNELAKKSISLLKTHNPEEKPLSSYIPCAESLRCLAFKKKKISEIKFIIYDYKI